MLKTVNHDLVTDDHYILYKYKTTMTRIIKSLYPYVERDDIEQGIEWSIQKRFKDMDASIKNNYRSRKGNDDNSTLNTTMLRICDYIAEREPIITSYGVLFKRHGTVPNPFADVIDNFLKLRKIHKKEMFKYPKGSEMFEHFNLLQQLDKIDVNAIYGYIINLAHKIFNGPHYSDIMMITPLKLEGVYV